MVLFGLAPSLFWLQNVLAPLRQMFHTPRTNVCPVVVVLSIHPSNFLILEEEDDGRGGQRPKRQQQIKNFKLKKKKTSY
jgi:hypothetical protein